MKNIHKIGKELFITNDEKIKDGWSYDRMMKSIGKRDNVYSSKIILTTDQDLIKDGVQAIDDDFLEWFVKNPSCEEVEIGEGTRYEDEWIDNEDGGEIYQHQYCCYKIIIPKEEPTILEEAKQRAANYMSLKGALEPKQETLEEAAESLFNNFQKENLIVPKNNILPFKLGFIKGAEWQAERMYSEEDMRLAIKKARDISDGKDCFDAEDISGCTEVCTYGWKFNMSEDLIIEQFKKK